MSKKIHRDKAIFGTDITATLATFLNAVLILGIRIPQENNALRLLKQVPQKGT